MDLKPTEQNNKTIEKKEKPLVSLIVSIVIPAIILSKFSTDEYLGVVNGFLIALAFPIGQTIYNFVVLKQTGFIAIIGFISIFLTGIIGIFNIHTKWLAVKEASIPLVIGIAILVSLKTKYPIVKKLLYNDEFLDIELIEQKLEEKNNKHKLETLLTNSTYILSASFLLSAVLNYIITKMVVVSPVGTAEFNAELGKLTAISYPMIALPSTLVMLVALWYLFRSLKKFTGLKLDDLMSQRLKELDKK